jgi:pyrroline-5-carboxylate reductase
MIMSLIGGGVMGEAVVRCIISNGIVTPDNIIVSDISQSRRTFLSREYSIKTTDNNLKAIEGADIILLAVKPQDINRVMGELKKLSPQQLVISIAAGITLSTLLEGLGHTNIVRAMPNMPAQIGEGVTVWTSTPEVSQEQKEMAKLVLSTLGEEIYVANEKYIDMATALSGSGPAYIFLIMEALIDAGVHIGLPRTTAEKLVIETTIGSARSIKITGKHPAELKNMVTSPGGTTAEGLLQIEKGGLRSLLLQAVIAAYEKAKKLGSK